MNVYDNSGFGLYVLSEIASSFGKFIIASNSKSLTISNREKLFSDVNFSGTYLSIELNSTPKHFSSLLKDIIIAGESEAKVSGNNSNASKLSKLF